MDQIVLNFEKKFISYINENFKTFTEDDLKTLIKTELSDKFNTHGFRVGALGHVENLINVNKNMGLRIEGFGIEVNNLVKLALNDALDNTLLSRCTDNLNNIFKDIYNQSS